MGFLIGLLAVSCGDTGVNPGDAAPGRDAPIALDASNGHPFTSQSGDSTIQMEPTIAANLNGQVVIAWIGRSPGFTVGGYAVSHDFGVTFSDPAVIHSPLGEDFGDPVLTTDSAGRFFLAWLGFQPSGDHLDGGVSSHIWVAQLTADTFSDPVSASAGTVVDKPWVTTDSNDDLLLTWTGENGGALIFAKSTDHGLTFSRTAITPNDGIYRHFGFPCLDRAQGVQGYIYVAYLTYGTPTSTLDLLHSTDSGASWQMRTTGSIAGDAAFQDPTCAVKDSEIWIAYARGAGMQTTADTDPATSVAIVRSGDRGITFDPVVTVATEKPETKYLFPQLVISPENMSIIFYQGSIGLASSVVVSTSSDGGRSWSNAILAGNGVFNVDRTTNRFFGDYIGLVFADRGYAAYVDNGAGTSIVRFLGDLP